MNVEGVKKRGRERESPLINRSVPGEKRCVGEKMMSRTKLGQVREGESM